MTTGARRRVPADVERLARATARPGIDLRTWVSAGRVDTAAGAIRWAGAHGWVVDVVFYGGSLEQEEVPARVANLGASGVGFGLYHPPTRGVEVLVGIPDGETENGPVVLGALGNETDRPPTEINGLPISEELESSSLVAVSPFDTEIQRSPHNRRCEWDGDLVTQARTVSLVSDAVRLGSETANNPALLGREATQNMQSILTALTTLATSLQGLTGPLVPLQAIGTALQAALEPISSGLSEQLSGTVTLD